MIPVELQLEPADFDETVRRRGRSWLDSPEHNEMRAKRFARYIDGRDEQTLREWSPFVWHEARRQNLL